MVETHLSTGAGSLIQPVNPAFTDLRNLHQWAEANRPHFAAMVAVDVHPHSYGPHHFWGLVVEVATNYACSRSKADVNYSTPSEWLECNP